MANCHELKHANNRVTTVLVAIDIKIITFYFFGRGFFSWKFPVMFIHLMEHYYVSSETSREEDVN